MTRDTTAPRLNTRAILSIEVAAEIDIVKARQRARQLALLLGFAPQDQARVATAVSETARNAYQYARGGRVDFAVDLAARPQFLWISVVDRGPGIANLQAVLDGKYKSSTGMGLGLVGTRRLMARFDIQSEPGNGTSVTFGKPIPSEKQPWDTRGIGQICSQLLGERPPEAFHEIEQQNKELLQTLELLQLREQELERRQNELARLNIELEETNRGVVALYAELDEKAMALRHADEMKSRFLSHVSHEFRTPVSSILALTKLLIRRVDGPLSQEQEKQVGYIQQAARELSEMVNDLLDLAKVEAGKTEVRFGRVDVGQFFGALRALMRPLAANEAVSLVFEDPAPGLTLVTDETKLGQILRNLISNALKFTEHGEIRVAAREAGPELLFSVTDTGIGIAPEDLDTIFQEFAQVDNRLQRKVKGTGLGLPLSRKLATLLDGALTATSTAGVGSTFTLSLPCSVPDRNALPDGRSELENDTILVIDDEPTSRYIVRQLFRDSTYRVMEAHGGIEGAERARFEQPLLIVLDLIMPDRNGFEVLEDLANDEETRDIPVVIHSSKHLTDADQNRLMSKVLAVLPKAGPGRREALEAIRGALHDPTLFADEPEFQSGRSGT